MTDYAAHHNVVIPAGTCALFPAEFCPAKYEQYFGLERNATTNTCELERWLLPGACILPTPLQVRWPRWACCAVHAAPHAWALLPLHAMLCVIRASPMPDSACNTGASLSHGPRENLWHMAAEGDVLKSWRSHGPGGPSSALPRCQVLIPLGEWERTSEPLVVNDEAKEAFRWGGSALLNVGDGLLAGASSQAGRDRQQQGACCSTASLHFSTVLAVFIAPRPHL